MLLLDALGPAAHTALRIGTGLLFLEHGLQKLFGWFGDKPPVEVASLLGLAGILETFGGLAIVLGLFTQPVAFVLCGQMAVAYAIAHLPRGPWPIENQGELALLYALIYAFLATHGAGPWSLDQRWRQADTTRRQERAARRPADRPKTPVSR
jgi:putative oxidoreductase